MLIKIGTHSFRKGVASFLASCPDDPGAISIFLRAGWTLGAVQSRYLFAGQGGKSLIISYFAQSTHHSLFFTFSVDSYFLTVSSKAINLLEGQLLDYLCRRKSLPRYLLIS